MTRLFQADGAITDTSRPVLLTLESLDAQVPTVAPLQGWWDASNPSYRIDIGGTGAVAVGSSTGTALTLTAVSAGAVAVGQAVTGTGVTAGTYIVSGSGLNWVLSVSQTIAAATTLNFAPTCSQVTDRSGNGNHFQQGTQASRPPVAINDWGVLNSVRRDSLFFDGATNYRMQTLANVFDTTTIWTMVLVCRVVDAGRLAVPLSISTSNRFELDNQPGGLGWRANAQVSTVLNAKSTNVLVIMSYNYPGSGNVTENMWVTDLGGGSYTRSVTYALGTTSPASSALVMGQIGSVANFGFKGTETEAFVYKADFASIPAAVALHQQRFQMKYRTA